MVNLTLNDSQKARFLAKIDRDAPNGCWQWKGWIDEGYGRFRPLKHGPQRYAHRLAFVLFVGPIPSGLEIDHLCRNRGCVNPAHMETVTHEENVRRTAGHPRRPVVHPTGGFNRFGLKTHCKRGHPFDSVNTYRKPNGSGRTCRACMLVHYANYRLSRKARRQMETA